MNTRAVHQDYLGGWVWLFPATYLAHLTEEYLGGFPQWISQIWGVKPSNPNFLIWNGAALVLMTASVLLVVKTRSFRWLLVAFATAVLINGTIHAIASVATRSYSPGLISGLLLFVPLGVVALKRSWAAMNRRTFRAGVIVGLAMHVAVVLLAFGFARISD